MRQSLGENSVMLLTLDNALMQAYAGGELAERLLVNALATVAPASHVQWSVDEAFDDLNRLRKAMLGSRLVDNGGEARRQMGAQPRPGGHP